MGRRRGGVRIKNTEGRREKEDGGEERVGGSATMRLKAYVPLRRLNVSRGGKGLTTHIHIHIYTYMYTYICTYIHNYDKYHARRRYMNVARRSEP